MALFISGTYVEDNELHYDNISLAIPMGPMKWDMLQYIRNSIDPPNNDVDTDWLDALFVAMDYLRSNEYVRRLLQSALISNHFICFCFYLPARQCTMCQQENYSIQYVHNAS